MNINISIEEYKTIRDALLELPAKEVYLILAKLDCQVAEQNKTKMAEAIKEKK